MMCKCRNCGGSIEWTPGDSQGLCRDCGAKQAVGQSDVYEQACLLAAENTEKSLEQAMQLFRFIRGWQDANRQYISCRTRLGRMRWKREALRLKEEENRFEAKVSCRKKIGKAVLTVVLLSIAVIITLTMIQFERYSRAAESFVAGEYERSAAAFQEMGDYRDSRTRVYLSAVELYKARQYEEALPYFIWLDGYMDNGYYLNKCQERLAAQNAAPAEN